MNAKLMFKRLRRLPLDQPAYLRFKTAGLYNFGLALDRLTRCTDSRVRVDDGDGGRLFSTSALYSLAIGKSGNEGRTITVYGLGYETPERIYDILQGVDMIETVPHAVKQLCNRLTARQNAEMAKIVGEVMTEDILLRAADKVVCLSYGVALVDGDPFLEIRMHQKEGKSSVISVDSWTGQMGVNGVFNKGICTTMDELRKLIMEVMEKDPSGSIPR